MQKLFLLFALMLVDNSLHAQTTSTKIRDTIVINQKFDYLCVNENGKLIAVVVNNDGSATETEVNPHKSPNQCLITDGKGDSLVIDNNGRPMGISEYRATGGNKALLNDYHRKKDSAAVWCVNFEPYPKQEFAFDYLGSSDHGIFATDECYPKSGNYDFRYKSVATSTTDRVIVDFDSYLEKDSVIFKDKYGVKLKLSKGNILTFTSTSTADTNYIYAYDKNDVRIGKLIVKNYAQKKYQICLVSVNGAKLPNQEKLKKYLDEIYHQANVEFEISVDELKIDNLFPFSHGDKNRFSGYNDDQKRVLEAYDSRIKENINYLFFIPDGAETNGVAGYNPFGYNFGFIYHGANNRTIAHELAHGIGSLRHPFNDAAAAKGRTDNLMDYNDGLSLWHFQWDMMQNPPRRIFKWRFEEEDAEMVEGIIKTEWVLLIYSPWVSNAFSEAYAEDDVYKMRRWTYKALNQSFEAEHSGWFTQQNANYTGEFANLEKRVARLIHYEGPYATNFFVTPQKKLENLALDGLFYPVDVFLYDELTGICDGESHYGPFDFIGTQANLTAIVGYANEENCWGNILKLFNLNHAQSYGLTIGRMRGYGICAYASSLVKGGGIEVGASVSVILANYVGKDKYCSSYWDINYGPEAFAGGAINFNFEISVLRGYDDNGNPNFEGVSGGLSYGLETSISCFYDKSELINLDMLKKK